MLRKISLLFVLLSLTISAVECDTVYGDTNGLNYCLSILDNKTNSIRIKAVTNDLFEVQRNPHIVKIGNAYCYREDISVNACVLISKEDAIKAINSYID